MYQVPLHLPSDQARSRIQKFYEFDRQIRVKRKAIQPKPKPTITAPIQTKEESFNQENSLVVINQPDFADDSLLVPVPIEPVPSTR
jgi:hypothetical protein